MPVTERRERRRLALRESILEAARDIVGAEGLRSLTMRRIAEAIDYAPASLYAHFASREALLAELCREGFHAMRLSLEASIAGASEPRERLEALGAAYIRFALEHPATYRLIFMEDAALTKGVFETLVDDDGERSMMLLAAPFFELRAAGAIPPSSDPLHLADFLFTLVHGIASLRLACPAVPASSDRALLGTAVAALTAARV